MHGTCGLNNPWHRTCGRCHNWVGIPGRPPHVIPRGSAGLKKKYLKLYNLVGHYYRGPPTIGYDVLCERIIPVGDMVYHISGTYCYAISRADFEKQSFTEETKISMGRQEQGCRGHEDGRARLNMDNGEILIYGIKKLKQNELETAKSLR